jgi:hypothetical protein
LALTAIAGCGSLTGAGPRSIPAGVCADAVTSSNPTAAENTCPGSTTWQPDHPLGPAGAIEGFSNPVSVQAGQTVRLYISTTAPTYSYTVYRLGWYGGLGARQVYMSASIQGIKQPAPTIDPVTRMVSAATWRASVPLTIPSDWVTGVYLVKLLSSTGYIHYLSFVVRDDASHATYVFQASVFTDQAYNLWGGHSLYLGLVPNTQPQSTPPHTPPPHSTPIPSTTSHSTTIHSAPRPKYAYAYRSYVVSFDRPYDTDAGLGDFAVWDINLLRWLERNGDDVAYTTDTDTDLSGSGLTQHKMMVVAGHSEYWSTAMRAHVTAARDAGVSLAFFGANNIYWHVRTQSSPLGPDREIICYKSVALDLAGRTNPEETTNLWRQRQVDDPENSLLGQEYAGVLRSQTSMRLAPGVAPFLEGTGLSADSTLPDLIGGEYDHPTQNGHSPPGLVILASSPVHCKVADGSCPRDGVDYTTSTLYHAASGAWVFDAGTFSWAWGLDDLSFDKSVGTHRHATAGFQRLTQNLLAFMLGDCAIPSQSDAARTPIFAAIGVLGEACALLLVVEALMLALWPERRGWSIWALATGLCALGLSPLAARLTAVVACSGGATVSGLANQSGRVAAAAIVTVQVVTVATCLAVIVVGGLVAWTVAQRIRPRRLTPVVPEATHWRPPGS